MGNKRTNILILSAGRRVELVRCFLAARDSLLASAKVFATDLNPSLSSASQVADQCFPSPRAGDAGFADFIEQVAATNSVGLIVPTIDTELLPLAKIKSKLAQQGTHISVSDESFVRQCRDKTQSGPLFEAIGVRYPKLMDWDNPSFPVFAKPASGSSSKGAMLLHDGTRLAELRQSPEAYMLMEYIGLPYREYTVDAYFDLASQVKSIVPRLRLDVRAGEVSKGITCRNGLFEKLKTGLQNWRNVQGCITIQVFYDENSDDVVGLEVNPRFGGGYPLTHQAGAKFVDWLVAETLLGKAPQPFDSWESDLLMLRYDAAIWVKNAKPQ